MVTRSVVSEAASVPASASSSASSTPEPYRAPELFVIGKAVDLIQAYDTGRKGDGWKGDWYYGD
jgi:hypothetical protein